MGLAIQQSLTLSICTALLSMVTVSRILADSPSVVKVVHDGPAWHLTVNGKPYFIKGAGGDASMVILNADGGNSVRTWGTDDTFTKLLEKAHKDHIMITAGLWLGHTEQGFNYNDPSQVHAQYEMVKKWVLKYRNSPNLLLWGLGNEMEGYQKGNNPLIWKAIEQIAKMVHRLDPNHPTMTVTADIGGDRVEDLNKYCPDIDIMGINSYAGAPSIPQRYRAAGGVKPYILTEFGPPGAWESPKTPWGSPIELTSTQKAAWYKKSYLATKSDPLCLGSYAFIWSSKQEVSATWYGMFLPDGRKLAAVDTMEKLWSGKATTHPCPTINSFSVKEGDVTTPGSTIHAVLNTSDEGEGPLKVKWGLQDDPNQQSVNGAAQAVPATYPEAVTSSSTTGATIVMPNVNRNYRLYAYVYNAANGAAVANIPIKCYQEGAPNVLSAGKPVALPFYLYKSGITTEPYTPSGYEGNYGAIKMNEQYPRASDADKTCIQVKYTASDQWGGVVWQNPPNNWGKLNGGYNITGATKLTFKAKADTNGLPVSFFYGVLGSSATYQDSSTASIKVNLTKQWKTYTIDLSGKDLSKILTGFGWSAAANGSPFTFYLTDIEYVK